MTTMHMQTLHVLYFVLYKNKITLQMLHIPPHPKKKKFVSTQHTISGSSVTSLQVIAKFVSEGNLREMFSDIHTSFIRSHQPDIKY